MPNKLPRPTPPALISRRQAGVAGGRALLLLAGLSATAGGVWFGLKRHGAAVTTDQASAAPASAPDTTAPSASAPLIQTDQLTAAFWQQQFDTPKGGQLSLAKAQGKPTLINFWATWCPPCVKEMPELDHFHREFTPKGWAVIGLAIDGPTPVKEFLTKVAVGFDLGLAGFGGTELAQALGNESGGLPFSVMIDAKGKVRHRKMGATHFEELATWARQIG
ncbi:MAG: TlpA family protein disulfide reductase [Aquabacterium sp.]|nr:MAG: TlpA family protein disulfide reductase [Aquabacterium sp.]